MGGYKMCGGCREWKPFSAFQKRRRSPDGLQAMCRDCRSVESLARYKRVGRSDHLWKKYRLRPGEYEAMLDWQGGGCAICGRLPTSKRLAVDHCHTSHEVRGLLCDQCNKGLGCFEDQPQRLIAAADYIRQHQARTR